jgi:hypothetical protein
VAAITVGTAGVLVRNRPFYTFGQHRIGWRDHNGHVLSSTSARLRYRVYDLLRWRWITLRGFISETGLALCFIIIGELVGEMLGAFKIKGEMVLIGAFTGFLIAELIKPKDPIKPLDKMFSGLFRKLLPNSR